MKIKKIFPLAVAFILLVFFGCKSSGGIGTDPKSVLAQFFEALSKKDVAAARKLTAADSQYMIDFIEEGLQMNQGAQAIDKYRKVKMEMGEIILEADKATIPVTATDEGVTMDYTLVKESGTWKVSFDKAALLEKGFEEMMEEGFAPADSIRKNLRELKLMNMDSLNAELRKEAKAHDTAH